MPKIGYFVRFCKTLRNFVKLFISSLFIRTIPLIETFKRTFQLFLLLLKNQWYGFGLFIFF